MSATMVGEDGISSPRSGYNKRGGLFASDGGVGVSTKLDHSRYRLPFGKIRPELHDQLGTVTASIIGQHQPPPPPPPYVLATKDQSSFYGHLLRMESWARLVGANLASKQFRLDDHGRWKVIGRRNLVILLWKMFLLVYLLQELAATVLTRLNDRQPPLLIDENGTNGSQEEANHDEENHQLLMLYMGDFYGLFGLHVDSFSIHIFKLCWGFHATFMYFWITNNNGKIRQWIINFDRRYTETAHCLDRQLETDSAKRMQNGTRFARLFIHWTTMVATGTVAILNLAAGYLTGQGRQLIATSRFTMAVYLAWSLVHILWFWLTFVINLTCFGHHLLLCRAIHIRFEETRADLEYAILGDRSLYTKPEQISGLVVKHYHVCDMVKQANKHLKIYLFIFYMVFAPHLCFMIYQIIFSSNFTAQGRILLGFMLIVSDFFQVYSVSVLSAQITSKSHEPYYAMHGVNKFENFPESLQLQTTLFMQRISNTVIGLTILDSFVLTGGLISSMLTAIITYFSVILENS